MINNDDQYHELPEWQDDFMDEEEEGESWKPNPTRDACKAMYEQWNEVVLILKAAFDSLKEPKDNDRFDKEYTEEFKASLLSDAFQVAIKIRSSVVDLYGKCVPDQKKCRKYSGSYQSFFIDRYHGRKNIIISYVPR
jgi:hypothetical protein